MPENSVSLRSRKKIKLRAHIQKCAIELFGQRGYSKTTVQRIAHHAEISPATFFHYFATKESVLFSYLMDSSLAQLTDIDPGGGSFIEALRKNVDLYIASLSTEEIKAKEKCFSIINATPELRASLAQTLSTRGMLLLIELIATQTGRPSDDVQVQVLAGAIMGAAIAILLDSADCTAAHCIGRFCAALEELEPRFEDV